MPNLQTRLEELARHTIETKDLEAVALYFFLNVVGEDYFRQSQYVLAPQLQEIVEKVTESTLGRDPEFEDFTISFIETAAFLHGVANCKGHTVTFYLFVKLGKGLAIISPDDLPYRAYYLRLTISHPINNITVSNPGGVH